jgi:hypothetical protein
VNPRAAGDSHESGRTAAADAPGHEVPRSELGPVSAQLEAVIGWRVRSRAREIGLSSAQLAERVGLSRAMISKK